MKKMFFFRGKFSILILSVLLITVSTFSPSVSAQDQDRIVEKVTVTNVEVPVRVLLKGIPVKDLTKADFELFENKKKVDINAFYVKKKKITLAAPEADAAAPAETPAGPPQPRSFVLVFNITDYNDSFKQAVDYLFTKILRENDRLMVFANDQTLKFPDVKDRQKVREKIVAILKTESQKARTRLIRYINQIETYLNVHDFRRTVDANSRSRQFGVTDNMQKLIDFLKKYLITWNDYKKRYLTPKTERFYFFARYLEKLKGEKWVLNFYQFELFPKIRIGSQTMNKLRDLSSLMLNSSNPTHNAMGRQMGNIMNQLMVDINVNQNYNNEEITKLFYKVDATFHSFFIQATSKAMSDNMEYRSLSSDIEGVLKGITDVTGGMNVTNNNLEKALNQVREVEDVYYVLSYVPKDPNKAGKLKIKVKKRGKYKVLYDDNFRADYITGYFSKLEKKLKTPDVKVEDFSFKRKTLGFVIRKYMMRNVGGKTIGRIKIRIRAVNAKNKAFFDSQKMFDAKKKEMRINIGGPFKKIPKGNYNFMIDVMDMFTGKQDNFHENVTVRR